MHGGFRLHFIRRGDGVRRTGQFRPRPRNSIWLRVERSGSDRLHSASDSGFPRDTFLAEGDDGGADFQGEVREVEEVRADGGVADGDLCGIHDDSEHWGGF